MKIPKLQFGLASIFVAFIGMAIVMSFYRHHTFVEERIRLHSQLRLDADRRLVNMAAFMSVLAESRAALLTGNEDHLESLASRYKIGQPLFIANVPIQLAQLDKNVRDTEDKSAQD